MKSRHIFILFLLFIFFNNNRVIAQNQDTIRTKILSELYVVGQKSASDIHQLPEIVGTNIYAGKKSSLVVLDNVQGNVVTNTMRQVMAKVPGIFIWENESSGIQINIAARGLSPNRSWEFNVRQNGYDIAADPYGYPEAYYNPQLQSVQRIEVVRGHGSLQYGPQIGGMVNYILKNGSEFTKPFHVETFQTIGSNGLFNSYNAVGGKNNKINYYAFFDHRSAEGWRDNNEYYSNTGSGSFTYRFNDKFSVTTEFTRWHSRSQQPGGLTDAQFKQDPQQSLRSRNWFDLTWQTIAVNTDYKINQDQRFNLKLFSITGDRNSVGYFPSGGITVVDAPDQTTGEYSSRTIDIDNYRNYGMEARYLHSYQIGRLGHNLSAGFRLYTGKTLRYRGGVGSRASDYDISLVSGTWSADIDYKSNNAAVFIENLFSITEKFLIIPGIRYEYIQAEATGYSGLSNGEPIYLQAQERGRGFIIGGVGFEYALTDHTRLYANATQSYRPIQFADLTTPPTTDVIDPNLKDAKGLNIDFGYRGNVKDYLLFDLSVFHLTYNNRIGTLKQQRQDGSFYNFRTNVGESRTSGAEAFTELNITKALAADRVGDISVFVSYAWNDARYKDFKVVTVVNNELSESNYRDKQVEYAPENILRTGLTYALKGFSFTYQYSFTDQVFADANNTRAASSNAQNGLVPSYSIMDITLGYKHTSGLSIKGGVNNLTNEYYFTRRAGGYPGPGVLPADGRTFFATLGFVMK